MALVITTAPTDELLSVEDAKRHLRQMSPDIDDEVASNIRAARDYCERFTQRTLRKTVTRTLTRQYWWPDRCWPNSSYVGDSWRTNRSDRESVRLPWPPLIAVAGITYYDTANAQQTLGTSNYSVEADTDGGGRIIWASTATIPALYDRPDAITITFTAGYADTDSLPPVALQAMKLMVSVFWGSGTDNEIKAAERSVESLLGLVDWTGYA